MSLENMDNILCILSHLKSAVAIVDLRNKLLFLNDIAEKLFQWKTDDVCGKNLAALCKKSNIVFPLPSNCHLPKQKHDSFEKELNFQCSGSATRILWKILPLMNKSNKLGGYILIGDEKSSNENKKLDQSNKELLQYLEKVSQKVIGPYAKRYETVKEYVDNILFYLENIIAKVPGSIFWKDKDGIYMGCNDYCARIAGFSSKKGLVGKTDFDFAKILGWNDNVTKSFREDDQKIIATGQSILNKEEMPFQNASGEYIYQLSNKVPLRDKEGNIVGMLGVAVDITQQKKFEKIIEEKLKEELSNQSKIKFMLALNQLIRTPLSSCIGNGTIIIRK